MPSETLIAKGRQTRDAIEQAARKLFAERRFNGATLADITSAAGKSPAVFYRCFAAVRRCAERVSTLRHGHRSRTFTTVFVGTSGLGIEIGDEDAISTLSRIWEKTLYGF